MKRSDVLNEDINKSLFDYYDELGELKTRLSCGWCLGNPDDLYAIDDQAICGTCLKKTKVKDYFND